MSPVGQHNDKIDLTQGKGIYRYCCVLMALHKIKLTWTNVFRTFLVVIFIPQFHKQSGVPSFYDTRLQQFHGKPLAHPSNLSCHDYLVQDICCITKCSYFNHALGTPVHLRYELE